MLTQQQQQQQQIYLHQQQQQQQQLMLSSTGGTPNNNCNISNSSGSNISSTTGGTSTSSNNSENTCCNNSGYYALIGNQFQSQQQQQQYHQSYLKQSNNNNTITNNGNLISNNPTLNTILSDPNAFPSLSQLVQSQNNQSCQSCMTPINNSNNNINNNSIIGNSSPHKYSKLQCTEQSILLQRCPNSDYKFIHEFGNDYISNNVIFKKFSNQDVENIYQYFKQGIKLQNKTCKNYVFEQCFDGQEAFLLLQEILLSKFSNLNDIPIAKLALHLGQFLLTIGKFNHVCKEHCFKNVNLLFYQFSNFNILHFNELKVTNSPNWYLIYPNIDSFIVQQSNNTVQLFQCNVPIREQFSPIFNSISILELKEILLSEVLPYEEGVEMLCRNDDINLFTFLQKTKFQEYPDYITIQLLSVQSSIQKSTIAIYSRCKYGYSDWGNNKERVNNWISKIVSTCQTHVISRKCSI
ncbi:hypothetical protein NAEGRDRAFT_81059 [Naegleria gruberi]|uniref:DEP domain-containing protein n=1 Tax=Naegleria gruberi TaxID=5762 RepID=D2VSE4_NAEGR|nr:uncharacterized protein NAEGRDRAFT_81059 [Naegleria gruberi]EFC40405.1 hypothetical protein NAEGRDRAFT_81059 [Naegleria gruberi]|eukprot:XP_002673149.1 hypothetical protein NAEGRDRAFT_81059 [Naegleria gruberi strain NEG-M]